ncbi:hypothetical protein ACLKA7_001908 [Drosophila subpalustris]
MSGSNGQPASKVRKLNFATNHDEMESPILRQEYTELRREVEGIKTSVEELRGDLMAALENMSKTIKSELSFVVDKLATQSAYIKQIAKRDVTSTEAQGSTFPISSEEDLMGVDLKILPENRHIYITKMKELLLQATLSKSIKSVLGEEIIMTHNIDGIVGKKRLKTYASFFPALRCQKI